MDNEILQDINEAVKKQVRRTATRNGIITLGLLIYELENCKQDDLVYYDFCHFLPDGIDSYRGYYDHLAIGYREQNNDTVEVCQLLTLCRGAVGKTFHGYKGGEFRMDKTTPVWVANRGRPTGTGIIGVTQKRYSVVIDTTDCED